MKILVTGANGFLGHYLVPALLEKGHTVLATGKGNCRLALDGKPGFSYETMDFTDPLQVKKLVERFSPAVIVHAGAMSKPDDCELNQADAYRVNTTATVQLVSEAGKQQSFFIFISTDFVFDGEKGMYAEEDPVAPVNFYGKTKQDAEAAVKNYPYDWAIVRTILVYGQPLAGRSNILSIVKEKLEKGETYKVVDDQLRTPTYVGDLASGIVAIIEKRARGIWHLSGAEQISPYGMACKAADYLQLDRSLLLRVTADTFSQPAKRPLKTGFVIDKAVRELGYKPVSFEAGLKLTFGPEHKKRD
ncbi:MAG: SDR family oxidoreductase [Sphingobacteriales bacterium]|nr:SDR family oxidoreductase [Sphingobacteriales bacterium]